MSELVMGAVVGAVPSLLLALLVANSAWKNGVTDGYGYAQEPGNPGYQKAGAYLKETMTHRWPQLNSRMSAPLTDKRNRTMWD